MNDPLTSIRTGFLPAQAAVDAQERSTPSLESEINWVLHHPGLSSWLKESLRLSLVRDPLSVLNELEVLRCLSERRLAVQAVSAACSDGRSDAGFANTGDDAR